ncbi:MAG: DUF4147 domain-containing protein [Planctomycetes bacterium]|nr:DUF4147 domain-containing protein [Planctomycetota bacterium]
MTIGFQPTEFARAVLEALQPARLFPARLRFGGADSIVPVHDVRGVTVIGLGKAAQPQVAATRALLRESLGEAIELPRSLAITKRGHGTASPACALLEASHPLCDESSLAAGAALRARVAATPADHLLVLCLSGGGSALAVAPRAPFDLHVKRAVNAALLEGGADIATTNRLRQEMSAIKNGGLLLDVGARRVLTLVTVDVPSEDLALVASGPSTWREREAGAIASDAHRCLPPPLAARFDQALASPSREFWQARLREAAARTEHHLHAVGDWETLSSVARDALRAQGIHHVEVMTRPLDASLESGTASILERIERLARGPRPAALLSGGELTVEVSGSGRGGRNSAFVLHLARALFHERRGALDDATLDRALVLSLATDGGDGNSDAAGGHVTRAVVGDSREAREALVSALARSDTATWLAQRRCAFPSTPSGTNLMDLRVVVLWS